MIIGWTTRCGLHQQTTRVVYNHHIFVYNVNMSTQKQKEKVINTRVSEELYEKIIAKSRKRRTTVSHLLRNVLEDVIDIHEDVSDIVEEKLRARLKRKQNVPLGYQAITLAQDVECIVCDKPQKRGKSAWAVVYNKPSAAYDVVCEKCHAKSAKR